MNIQCAKLVNQFSRKQPCFDIGCADRSDPATKSYGKNTGVPNVLVIHATVCALCTGMSIIGFGLENQPTFTFNSETPWIHSSNPPYKPEAAMITGSL